VLRNPCPHPTLTLSGPSYREPPGEVVNPPPPPNPPLPADPAVATRYGVEALPTLVLFKDGKEVDRFEGVEPAPALAMRIKQKLGY